MKKNFTLLSLILSIVLLSSMDAVCQYTNTVTAGQIDIFRTPDGNAGILNIGTTSNFWHINQRSINGNAFSIYRYNNGWTGIAKFMITNDGTIGINTESPNLSYKLDVNGRLRANEVVVNTTGSYPDYVFGKDYKLKSLEEVEAYINKYKHLEGIPTTKEAEEKGIPLAEMNTKLLEKVEELTLYMIDMKKSLNELKSENEMLKSKVGIVNK